MDKQVELDRLMEEIVGVKCRLNNLNDYLIGSEFETIEEAEKILLTSQQMIMNEYLQVLLARKALLIK